MIVAIRNKKTKEYVYGTDYRYNPNHQRTSPEKALLYELNDKEDASFLRHEIYKRQIGDSYELTEIHIEPVKNGAMKLVEKEIRKSIISDEHKQELYKKIEEIFKEAT